MVDSIGVVVACHNEARYLARTLSALRASLSGMDNRLIVIADRCTDDSPRIARRYCEVISKDRRAWQNSYAENLNIGFEKLLGLDYVAMVDADMVVPRNFFSRAVAELKEGGQADSVSSVLYAEPASFYNKLYHGYELSMERLRFTKRRRKHGQRVYRGVRLVELYESKGAIFSDVLGPDTFLDKELGTPVAVMGDVVVWHVRKTGLRKSLAGQLRQGRAAKQNGSRRISVIKETFRLRPVVPISFWLGPGPNARDVSKSLDLMRI